jgi:hypothetical protein
MLKELNSLLQKGNKVTKAISDLNAVNEATKGNTRSLERKVKNKVKNKLWGLIK